ncbi:hypothetical protein YC2023_047153 [Brassica napus]
MWSLDSSPKPQSRHVEGTLILQFRSLSRVGSLPRTETQAWKACFGIPVLNQIELYHGTVAGVGCNAFHVLEAENWLGAGPNPVQLSCQNNAVSPDCMKHDRKGRARGLRSINLLQIQEPKAEKSASQNKRSEIILCFTQATHRDPVAAKSSQISLRLNTLFESCKRRKPRPPAFLGVHTD